MLWWSAWPQTVLVVQVWPLSSLTDSGGHVTVASRSLSNPRPVVVSTHMNGSRLTRFAAGPTIFHVRPPSADRTRVVSALLLRAAYRTVPSDVTPSDGSQPP